MRQRLESLLCHAKSHREDCCCNTLKSLYGIQLFRCFRLGCKFSRVGFEEKAERDAHMSSHDRPYKCSAEGCDFDQIGFVSLDQLKRHVSNMHPKEPHSSMLAFPIDFGLDPIAEMDLARSAVRAGEVGFVSVVCERLSQLQKQELLCMAAAESTVPMMEMLLNQGADIDLSEVKPDHRADHSPLVDAIQARNLTNTKFLLERGASVELRYGYNSKLPLDFALGTNNYEAMQLLLAHGSYLVMRNESLVGLTERGDNDPTSCMAAIKCLELYRHGANARRDLNSALKGVAQNGLSLLIARWLINAGADVNSRGRISSENSKTALQAAAGRGSKEAAELMRLLLESGADPDLYYTLPGNKGDRKKAGDFPGGKEISKWRGVSWEELVESTRSKRIEQEHANSEAHKLPLRTPVEMQAFSS